MRIVPAFGESLGSVDNLLNAPQDLALHGLGFCQLAQYRIEAPKQIDGDGDRESDCRDEPADCI